MDPDASPTRCGYVALVGAPNAGKSSLMNAVVGQRLSIVTPKPQTTWERVVGLRSSATHQIIFLDTPGTLSPKSLIDRSLMLGTNEAVREADVVLVVLDTTDRCESPDHGDVLDALLATTRAPVIGVLNKIDIAGESDLIRSGDWLQSVIGDEKPVLPVSAAMGKGIGPLLRAIEGCLPEGPFLYPADDLGAAPTRFFVAEIVREAIFDRYHSEVPYASICRVEEFREAQPKTYIQVTIYVERASQKGIIVGDKGAAIRELGKDARTRVETFLGTPVYLDLWVKVLPNWRRRPERLRSLGLPVPSDERAP